ncbi:ABC transporter permease [Leadbettera azotonutricia]|uniref:ABC transporter, permease protein n=1 Tax=Leadbettera azotonutricia (strain ATCC BAA-888 / DSM 13862 / ZAS-9) TaxID=545695 RepID=F5YG58_LEAAZ|nr:ABC transporter permease [Leadbettera azotonutricia]AEF82217.1 ABC transporter, permease protein [Leadbettera azotonutricia ZAS-9]
MKALLQKLSGIARTLFSPIHSLRRSFPLLSYIIGRFIIMAAMLFLLGFAVFGLMELAPGDIVDQIMIQQLFSENQSRGSSRTNETVNMEQYEAQRAYLGLDQPFYIQYFRWINRVVVYHDLGVSLISRAPVSFLIASRLFNSLLLNLISLVLITVFSFILGVYFSAKAGTRTDLAVTFFALVLHAFPGILLLILLQLFASVTNLFPVTAYPSFPFSEAPGKFVFSYAHHVFLPLLASFLGGIGGTLRMIRATMLDQLGQPYITSLRSRGIAEWKVYFFHAFRNTLNPYITGSANLLAGLFSGSLILEIIFAYPGIGRLMYEAVLQEDINLVLSNIMFISFLVLLGMVLADILLALVDPRIRYGKN